MSIDAVNDPKHKSELSVSKRLRNLDLHLILAHYPTILISHIKFMT